MQNLLLALFPRLIDSRSSSFPHHIKFFLSIHIFCIIALA